MRTTSDCALALFVHKRPEHLNRCLDSLLPQKSLGRFDIHVFSDGPKTREDISSITHVRDLVIDRLKPLGATFHIRDANAGLSRSIREGLNTLAGHYRRFVVVEDDLLLGPRFLEFMLDGLERYDGHPSVACIHGYALPIAGLPSLYFLRGGDCWGWGTWSNKWRLFRLDATRMLQEIMQRGLLHSFDRSTGSSQAGLLLATARGLRDSWAINWHASLYLANQLTLHPGRSLISNIGNDASGTHAADSGRFDTDVTELKPEITSQLKVAHNEVASTLISTHFDRQRLLPAWLHQQQIQLRCKHWLRNSTSATND